MLSAHLPALQVAIPLAAAPVCLLWRRPGHAWLFTTLVSLLVFGISLLLLQQVHKEMLTWN